MRKKTFFSHKHIVCPIVYHCLLFLLTLFFPFLSQLLTLYLHYLSESMVLHYTGKSIERLNDPTNRDFCDLPFLEVVSFCSSNSFRSSWDEVLVCVGVKTPGSKSPFRSSQKCSTSSRSAFFYRQVFSWFTGPHVSQTGTLS